MSINIELPTKKPRTFLPEAFVIDTWTNLAPYFQALKDRKISSTTELKKWLHDRSELETIVQEDAGWRYIRMTCDTTDKAASEKYNYFITEIDPNIAPFENELNMKLLESPFRKELTDEADRIYIRDIEQKVKIFREKNIPLLTKLQTDAQEFAVISGAMTVEVKGKELTLQQAANFLKENDRKVREEIYYKIANRRLQDKDKLNDLYTTLVKTRDEVATNADFKNFRDYMFASLGRFDYSVQDCYNFHEAIQEAIVPLVSNFDKERKQALNLDSLKPWDKEVDISGKPPLIPFHGQGEIMEKTISCFNSINPFLGDAMQILNSMKHVDLDSRIGKAPGGYNYPLYESGVPFIFMNSAGNLHDLVTIVHEGGHAVHSLLVKDLDNVNYKSTPSEVAELASMSMELISMEHWDVYFKDQEELKRAKKQHLESIIKVLPWIATIDKFQHWVYLNPNHTLEERKTEWVKTFGEFAGGVTDWTGQEHIREFIWQKQLHLYEVPFYYIEYGMAQLGAIAMWRSYKKDANATLQNYMNALKLGYTKTIGDIYKTAGIKFDFSKEYVKELAAFVKEELEKLN